MPPLKAVPAAGTLPWRITDGELQVALVHRPRYDDWSWAKGKLDPGEEWAAAAARETFEETALRVRLGRPLPEAAYQIFDRDGSFATKQVRYWAAVVTGGTGRLANEIDEVVWLSPNDAHKRLDYSRDQDQLLALVGMHRRSELATWPLIIVRHAIALPRSRWSRQDWLRPLDPRGQARAGALAPLLAAYGPMSLISSSSTRCQQTLAPYGRASRTALSLKASLSEESFEKKPQKAIRVIEKAFDKAEPVAICTHRPLLPAILRDLAERPAYPEVKQLLEQAAEHGMEKGEIIVCHVAGAGPDARIVAAESHLP